MINGVLVLNVVVDADSIDLKALGCFPMSGVNSRLAGQNAFGAEYLLQSALSICRKALRVFVRINQHSKCWEYFPRGSTLTLESYSSANFFIKIKEKKKHITKKLLL